MLGGLGNLAGLLKQAKTMQAKAQEMQQQLKDREVEGSAGGEMVTATVNGQGTLTAIRISPEIVDPSDVEMLEDLVKAAVASAQTKAQEMAKEDMSRITGGMDLGNLGSLLGGGE